MYLLRKTKTYIVLPFAGVIQAMLTQLSEQILKDEQNNTEEKPQKVNSIVVVVVAVVIHVCL